MPRRVLLAVTLLCTWCTADLMEPANEEDTKLIRHLIVSVGDLFLDGRTEEEKETAVQELAAFSKRPDGVAKIVEVHGIKPLVDTARDGKSVTQRQGAAAALAWIARTDVKHADQIVALHGISVFVGMARHGGGDMKKVGLLALTTLVNQRLNYTWDVAEFGGIATTVNIVNNGTAEEKTKAVSALNIFSRLPYSMHNTTIGELIVLTGGAPAIVSLIHTGTQEQLLKALMTTCNLVSSSEAHAATFGKAGAIPPLVALLANGSARLQESAALALSLLVRGSNQNRDALGKDELFFSSVVARARDGAATALMKRHAVQALLSATSNHADNMKRTVEAGAIPALVELAKNRSDTDAMQMDAVMLLARLAVESDEHLVSITAAGGVSADQAKQSANFLLRQYGINSGSEPMLHALANMAGITMEISPAEQKAQQE